ncbi:hypothetical protein OGAPHI_000066 [Ogataea philodendri]|uniref:Uncharacterized protein n=1 Tax=Ogataea philodendri TaxID=1378263 RepID=A0A9P8PHS5_9ASCO|nr:uncharacterized protein OGAPHI_000066 [Ogataea philodendri]KAH3671880.1 hypothetical protein OGAPHI_000066 [Ogataea philodendri]
MSFIDRWVYKNKARQLGVNNTGTHYNPTTVTPQEQYHNYPRRASDTQPNLRNIPYNYFHGEESITVQGDDGKMHTTTVTTDGFKDANNRSQMVSNIQPASIQDRKASIGSITSESSN